MHRRPWAAPLIREDRQGQTTLEGPGDGGQGASRQTGSLALRRFRRDQRCACCYSRRYGRWVASRSWMLGVPVVETLHERWIAASNVLRQSPHRPQQFSDLSAPADCPAGIAAMLQCILVTPRCAGRLSAVHPAPTVRHRRRLALCSASRMSPASWTLVHG